MPGLGDFNFIANGYQQPDPFAMATKGANLQSLQIANQTNQGNLNEVNNLRSLATDPSVRDANGNIDQDKYLQKAQQVAPTLGANQAHASENANQANTAQKAAHFQFDQGQLSAGQASLNALLGDPRIMGRNGQAPDPREAAQAIMEQEDRMTAGGIEPERVRMLTAPFYVAAGHYPAALPDLVKNSIKAQLGPAGVVSANTPNLVSTGGENVNINPLNQGGQVKTIPNTLPPTTPTVVAGPNGSVTPTYVGQTAGGSQVPAAAPQYGPVDAARVAENTGEIQRIRRALADPQSGVPVQHQVNSTLLQLVNDPSSTTGMTADKQARFQGALANIPGVGQFISDKGTTNYDEINAYLDRQLLASASTMTGGNTDAARSLVGGAVGSPAMTKEALAEKIKFNDELASATDAFGKGLDKAIGVGGNQNPAALDQYRSQWAANNDPLVFRLNQAKARGDQQDYDATLAKIKSLPPAQRALVFSHAHNINALTTTGSLQ